MNDADLGLRSYKLWIALRQHFTTESYDFMKYHGGTRHGRKQYEKRNDMGFFYRLAKKYPKHLRDFYLSVYCRAGNEDAWIGSFYNDPKYHAEFVAWQKRNQARTKQFQDDVNEIADAQEEFGLSFRDVLISRKGKLPLVVQLETKDYIAPETVVVINHLTRFTDLDCLHPSWPDTKLRLTKYARFVSMDKLMDYAGILKDALISN